MKLVKVPRQFKGSPPKPKRKKRKPQHFDLAVKEAYAARLREKPTQSEALMCQLLDSLNIDYEFQAVICGYIPDFFFPEKRRIIELDGRCHRGRKVYDQRRDEIIRKGGYKILRLPSSLIFKNVDRLIELVREFLGLVPKQRRPLGKRSRAASADDSLNQFYFATAGI